MLNFIVQLKNAVPGQDRTQRITRQTILNVMEAIKT